MELTVSMLVALSVFCTFSHFGQARLRRLAALSMLRPDDGRERPATFRPHVFALFRKSLTRLGQIFRSNQEDKWASLIQDTTPEWTPSFLQGLRVAMGSVLALLVLPLGVVSLLLAPLAFALGYRLPVFMMHRKRRRALEAVAADLPEIIDLTAVLCYSGESLHRALQHSLSVSGQSLTRRELARLAERMRLGESIPEVIGRLSSHPSPELRRFSRTVLRADESGAPTADILEALASELRASRRERNRTRAARASVLILFPLVFLILPSFLLLTVGSMILGHVL